MYTVTKSIRSGNMLQIEEKSSNAFPYIKTSNMMNNNIYHLNRWIDVKELRREKGPTYSFHCAVEYRQLGVAGCLSHVQL